MHVCGYVHAHVCVNRNTSVIHVHVHVDIVRTQSQLLLYCTEAYMYTVHVYTHLHAGTRCVSIRRYYPQLCLCGISKSGEQTREYQKETNIGQLAASELGHIPLYKVTCTPNFFP